MANIPNPNAPRMRQAFILGWPLANLGGVNEVVRCLVREFQASGPLAPLVFEVTSAPLSEGVIPGLPVFRLPLPALYNRRHPLKSLLAFLYRLPELFWTLRRHGKQFRISVLNPHFVGMEHFGLMLFRRSGLFQGKLILSFHGSDIRRMLQAKGYERLLYRLLLRGADVLVPCSFALAEEILMLAPECAGRIVPVQNGIDIERFAGSSEAAVELPAAFLGRRKLLNIGAFEYKKGHDILLRAFALVRRARQDVCLIIAGQSSEALPGTQRLIEELGLTGDVLLLRDLPHARVAALLRASDVFVFSSRWEKGICGEGFAMALLEAAALSKPVISTDSCGVAELVTNGETGLVVPPERPELLAGAINTFLDDPTEAARQAANLYRVVSQQFTWAEAHARYLQAAAGAIPKISPASPSGIEESCTG